MVIPSIPEAGSLWLKVGSGKEKMGLTVPLHRLGRRMQALRLAFGRFLRLGKWLREDGQEAKIREE